MNAVAPSQPLFQVAIRLCVFDETWKSEERRVMAGPLDGVKILDLTSLISGPGMTMLLGDQGADVIKVENPNGGDHGPLDVERVLALWRGDEAHLVEVLVEQGRDVGNRRVFDVDVHGSQVENEQARWISNVITSCFSR